MKKTLTEVNKGKISDAAELMKKGASLLGETCPKCGGLQVRYKDRTYCLSCNDLSDLDIMKSGVPTSDIPQNLRGLIMSKLQKLSEALSKEEEIDRQAKIADLILLYMEIIERIK